MDTTIRLDTRDLTPNRRRTHTRNLNGTYDVYLGDIDQDVRIWHGDADSARSLAEQWAGLAHDLSATDADAA